MRRFLVAVLLVVVTSGSALAEVDLYVSDLNIYASRQFDNFRAELSYRYGISRTRFDTLLGRVDSPGDLAVSLWLGLKAEKPVDDVIRQYRLRRGQGWGVIAKKVGIQPGSPAFKKLKKGEIDWLPKNFDEVMKDLKKPKGASGEAVVETERERKIREAHERKEKKRQERANKMK